MNSRSISYVLLFFLGYFNVPLFAQQHKIDSLKKVLRSNVEDTNKVIVLYRLCWESRKIDPEKALQYGKEALELAIKLNFRKGIASSYNNMGGVFEQNGDDKRALKFYLMALDIKKEMKDKRAIAGTLINIGILYKKQENYDKALFYYYEALALNKESDYRKFYLANIYNISSILKIKREYSKANNFLLEARNIAVSLGDSEILFSIYNSLGNLNGLMKNNDDAIAYFDSALTILDPQDNEGKILNFLNRGSYYFKSGDLKKGEELLNKAYELKNKRDWGTVQHITMDLSQLYHELYLRSGDKTKLEKSLSFLEEAFNARDSVIGIAKQQSVLEMIMQNKLEGKESEIKDIMHQKQIADIEAKDQRTIRNLLIIGSVLLFILAAFIFWNFRQKKRANIVIEAQKMLVEDKNKDILDSIHYAKRIQRSLLPTEKYIERNLKKLLKNK